MRRLSATAFLAVAAAFPALGQSSPIVDSVAKLSRAGLWEQAGPLAMRSAATVRTVDDRCALLLAASYAAWKLALLDNASVGLAGFDRECVDTPLATYRAAEIAAIRADRPSSLPGTGIELSAIDKFWAVADALSRDVEPTDDAWRSLLSTATYRMVLRQNGAFRSHMSLAFKPSRSAERDSLAGARAPGSGTVAHLRRAYAARRELDATRAALERTIGDSIAIAVRSAQRFLRPGATQQRRAPFVAIGIYINDGYAQQNGMILDLLSIHENGLTSLLAHEFHHIYATSLGENVVSRPNASPGESAMLGVFFSLRNEGIADLIDKPYPLVVRSAAREEYAQSYNAAYARTPAILRSMDSVIAGIIADSTKLLAAAQAMRSFLPWNAHPNGAYLAREVYETFGVDSLFPALSNPFALMRVFRAAEAKRGAPPAFSPASISWLDDFERRFVRR
jgi:hypothetical protein